MPNVLSVEAEDMLAQARWRPLNWRKGTKGPLKAQADLKTLAATIRARWVCAQAHQQVKEELGLDHFEGRSWRGLHRHALMANLVPHGEVVDLA